MPHRRQRIAREIRTRHGEEQGLVRSDGIAVHDRKRSSTRKVEVLEIQPAHRREHELVVIAHRIQALTHRLGNRRVGDIALRKERVGERRTNGRIGIHGFSHELLHIEDLGSLAAKNIGERIVLLLSVLKIEAVVNPDALEVLCFQVHQILAGTMNNNLLQRTNFAVNAYPLAHAFPSFLRHRSLNSSIYMGSRPEIATNTMLTTDTTKKNFHAVFHH